MYRRLFTMNLLLLFIGAIVVLNSGCSLQGQLTLIQKIDSKVPEASGLALRNDTLYVVSDKNGDIYMLNTQGIQISRLKTKTKDVEGITWCNGKIYLANEANQKIYAYSRLGDRLKAFQLKEPKIYNPKSGLEGLTYDEYTNTFMVIYEKEAGQLLQFDTSFVLLEKRFLGSFSDYSGIATTKNYIWIISDEAASMAQYDREMNLIKLYPLGIESPEGIAISESTQTLYVISDTSSELAVFKLPQLQTGN